MKSGSSRRSSSSDAKLGCSSARKKYPSRGRLRNAKRSTLPSAARLVRSMGIRRLVSTATPDRQAGRLGDRLDERGLAGAIFADEERHGLSELEPEIANERNGVGKFVEVRHALGKERDALEDKLAGGHAPAVSLLPHTALRTSHITITLNTMQTAAMA